MEKGLVCYKDVKGMEGVFEGCGTQDGRVKSRGWESVRGVLFQRRV